MITNLSRVALVFALSTEAGAQLPAPTVRELTTIPGEVVEAIRMHNGRVVLFTVADSILAWDIRSRRRLLVTTGFDGELALSPMGDRIAYATPEGHSDMIVTLALDPGTGAAIGAPTRVGTRQGDDPSFSPDGSQIAFAADGDALRVADLVVAPTAGGSERVLAQFDRSIWNLSWSADARWMFLTVGGRSDSASVIYRVPIAGGPPEVALTFPALSGQEEWTIGGAIAVVADPRAQAEGRLGYISATGERGEFRIPAASMVASVGWSTPRTLLLRNWRNATSHLLNVADGSSRTLPAGTRLTPAPRAIFSVTVWSPDGQRFALADSVGDHLELSVWNADGTRLRRYPIAIEPTLAVLRWSPDSRLLAFHAGRGATSVGVLDPNTGQTRTVFSSPDVTALDFAWRPEGASIVVLKWSEAAGEQQRALYEAQLDGTNRKLRDLDATRRFTRMLTDRLVQGADDGAEWEVVPTAGGPGRVKPAPGHGFLTDETPGASRDGQWLFSWLRRARGEPWPAGQLASTAGDSSRIVHFPFAGHQGFQNIVFDADGNHVILVGTSPADSVATIFRVPLDGTAPRALTTLPRGMTRGRQDLSPDGRKLLYTIEGQPMTTVYELDTEPLLKALCSRTNANCVRD